MPPWGDMLKNMKFHLERHGSTKRRNEIERSEERSLRESAKRTAASCSRAFKLSRSNLRGGGRSKYQYLAQNHGVGCQMYQYLSNCVLPSFSLVQ